VVHHVLAMIAVVTVVTVVTMVTMIGARRRVDDDISH
jgi:hypothetical protein